MMKILGIGNALIDVLVKLEDDALLKEFKLPKGSMSLIDKKTRDELLGQCRNYTVTTGGSAGNTCLALANMEVPVGFIGKVGDNDYGKFYIQEFKQVGVQSHFIHVNNNHTGTAMTLISPDGERTFGTYLGIAAELNESELNRQVFSAYTHFYMEGYLVQNHDLIEGALKLAKSSGLKTAIDLASYNIVEAEHDFLSGLIDRYVDIVFANEEEAKALTGHEPVKAIAEIGKKVEISVVKSGKNGSYVMKDGEIIHVPVEIAHPVDTTAAGDYYAAGFFYGMQQNKSMEQCAKLGSLLAKEIIQVVGTKLSQDCWNIIKDRAQTI